jgi:hypothetical protein
MRQYYRANDFGDDALTRVLRYCSAYADRINDRDSRLTLLIPLPPFPSVAKSRGDLASSSSTVSFAFPLPDMVSKQGSPRRNDTQVVNAFLT